MNIPLLVLLAAAAVSATDEATTSSYRAMSPLEAALDGRGAPIVRGQSPYGSEPLYTPGVQGDTTTLYPPTYAPDGTTYPTYDPAITTDPYGNPQPYYPGGVTSDPWLQTQPGAPAPYYGAQPYGTPSNVPQGFYTYGMNGPQPYRYGLQERVAFTWLPESGTSSPNRGDFEMLEFDFEKALVTPLGYNWVFTASPQFNFREWAGPRGMPGPANLPSELYRFGLNLQLATPMVNGWSGEIGFNPAYATDFDAGWDSDAWFFDFYGVAFWQWNPQWTWALGVLYWDRVDDIILPYAGLVYLPNDYWEFRLVFPNPRISYFLGTPYGVATWVYVGADYHVEAYYIDLDFGGAESRVQYSDWRLYVGMRWEAGQFVTNVDVGAAVGRQVQFDRVGQDFDVDSGFFARAGLRW